MLTWIKKKILIIFLFFIIPHYSFAEPTTYCEKFIDEIRQNQIIERLDWGPRPESHLEAGFYLKTIYQKNENIFDEKWGLSRNDDNEIIFFEDEELGKFSLYRNDKNNVEVLTPYRYNEYYEVIDAYKKLKPNDEIISINGKKINSLNDEDIYDLLIPNYKEYDKLENSSITIEFLRNEKLNQTEIQYEYIPYINYNLAFYINSIFNLDSKKTTFDMNYYLYVEWSYDKLVNIAKKLNSKINPPTDEFTLDYLAYCPLTEDEFDSMEMYQPAFDILNKLYRSEDVFDTYYMLDYWEDENGEGGAEISYTDEGVATLESNFDFSAFPFDSQILKIDLGKDIWDAYFVEINQFIKSFENINLEKIDKIPDWDITAKSLTADYYYDEYQEDYMPKFTINLRIERNYLYYLYKIFIPICIILFVAWSALWIRPSQIEARLTVTIVCLLSLIAYNYIYEGDLPKLDYITLMDYIILLAYAFAAIPTIVSVISYERFKNNTQNERSIDSITKIVGPILFLLISGIITFAMIYGNENISMTLRAIQGMKN